MRGYHVSHFMPRLGVLVEDNDAVERMHNYSVVVVGNFIRERGKGVTFASVIEVLGVIPRVGHVSRVGIGILTPVGLEDRVPSPDDSPW